MAPIRSFAAVFAAFAQPPSGKTFFKINGIESIKHSRLPPFSSECASIKDTLSLSHINDNSFSPSGWKRQSALFSSASSLPISSKIISLTSSIAGSYEAFFYMVLLALQFGLQPVLTKRFTPKTINRSTVVMAQDITKFVMAGIIIFLSGGWASAIDGWTVSTWLTVAGLPASLYCIQNIATLVAYQNLSPLTFNVLNQTKTLSAALCCYLIMGRKQSKLQVVALLLLFTSACVIEKIVNFDSIIRVFPWIRNEKKNNKEVLVPDSVDCNKESGSSKDLQKSTSDVSKSFSSNHGQGVIAVLLASFISGLAGAVTQKNLQSTHGNGRLGGRNSYLFTMELSVASIIVLASSMSKSNDGKRVRERGFFDGWTPQTFIPIITNAAGGIVVGLVTKHAGAVKKGFALIFGLLLSGILQIKMDANGSEETQKISKEQIIGGILASVSLWMHCAFPVI